MDNPIPSVMVYFDKKERRAVLCLDKGVPPNLIESCNKNGEFHTHSWLPLGWMSEAAFCTSKHQHGLAAEFVHSTMFAVISIRNRYESMERDRDATLRANENLRASIRELVAGLDGTICHIESEEKRLEVAGLVVRHGELNLADDEVAGEAS